MTLLSETQIEPETDIETATDDLSKTAQENAATASLYGRYYSLMNNVVWSPFSREEWLPYSPVDVDERVYVKLGDRTYTGGEHEQSVGSFIGELQALAAKAPKRATAIIKLGTGYGCDDESCRDPEWEVGYWRDPTKKERAEREETNRKIAERDDRHAKEAADKERAEYERMKAKFEGAAK